MKLGETKTVLKFHKIRAKIEPMVFSLSLAFCQQSEINEMTATSRILLKYQLLLHLISTWSLLLIIWFGIKFNGIGLGNGKILITTADWS